MRIARIGNIGSERPVIIKEDKVFFIDKFIKDFDRETLTENLLSQLSAIDLTEVPNIDLKSLESKGIRIGSPISRPTKLICVGLNYTKHIAETNAQTPPEPIIFMKAPDTLIGPNDDITIPPDSNATDYEVELAIVIGKRALYLPNPDSAEEHIFGYSISQDISERHWQLERSGQWVKGKSFPNFNPLGPVVVTRDEFSHENSRIWCSINDELRQDSSTSDLLYGVNHLVWYLSQFMELFPGDVINSGTPGGVGMGFFPPKYLQVGDIVHSGIAGIGEIRSKVIPTA